MSQTTLRGLQARLIAEAILELKANAAKCHVDLVRAPHDAPASRAFDGTRPSLGRVQGMYVQKAIDKGAHSLEAIEADRIRLVNEVRAPPPA